MTSSNNEQEHKECEMGPASSFNNLWRQCKLKTEVLCFEGKLRTDCWSVIYLSLQATAYFTWQQTICTLKESGSGKKSWDNLVLLWDDWWLARNHEKWLKSTTIIIKLPQHTESTLLSFCRWLKNVSEIISAIIFVSCWCILSLWLSEWRGWPLILPPHYHLALQPAPLCLHYICILAAPLPWFFFHLDTY